LFLLSLLFLGFAVAPLRDAAATAVDDPSGGRLTTGYATPRLQFDLPSLVPHPADLGARWVDGGGAGLWTLEHFAASNHMTLAQAQARRFVGSYDHAVILIPNSGAQRQLQQLRTTLVVYQDADAAAADYIDRVAPDGWEWVDTNFSIGEDTRVRRGSGEDNGGSWRAIGFEFHVDNVVFRFELYEFGKHPANGLALTTKGLQPIADRVRKRVAAQLAKPDPTALQLRLLRLGGNGVLYPILFDDYTVLDGKVMRYYGDTDEAYAFNKQGYADTIDSYLLEQTATIGGQTVYVYPALTRYADAETASAQVDCLRAGECPEPMTFPDV
jgi:hypothetical protein